MKRLLDKPTPINTADFNKIKAMTYKAIMLFTLIYFLYRVV